MSGARAGHAQGEGGADADEIGRFGLPVSF